MNRSHIPPFILLAVAPAMCISGFVLDDPWRTLVWMVEMSIIAIVMVGLLVSEQAKPMARWDFHIRIYALVFCCIGAGAMARSIGIMTGASATECETRSKGLVDD